MLKTSVSETRASNLPPMVKKMRYTSHPYAIYVRSPLCYGRSNQGAWYSNNYGFASDKPTSLIKSKTRVMCIGGSTTELTDGDNYDNHYPNWLGRELGETYEVINAGCCGYTSAEMLINFELRLLDFKPDYLVIYEAINDVLYAGMYEGFQSDYSHSRKNVGMHKEERCITGCVMQSHLMTTETYQKQAVETFKRNIKSICAICVANGIHPIIVKFNYNPDIETAERIYPLKHLQLLGCEKLFLEGLKANISVLNDIANEVDGTTYVETEPMTPSDFIDSCHLKTSGMQKMAKAISVAITKGVTA